ncbi:MAG: DNA (cytosine-5-)-methyltransferase [Acidobacteriaceae bacterium]
MSLFTFADLFSGLGGFHQAARALGGTCVFASEIDPDLRELYKRNFGILPSGDIRSVRLDEVPKHDILFAGFPCQPFSKAGKQLGWQDAVRGTLFENILNIAVAKRPRVLILENVAHFVRHDDGQTYAKVQAGLKAAGYDVMHRHFSPHQFAVPHIRERVYLVASRSPLKEFEWPATDGQPITDVKDVLDKKPRDAVEISQRVRDCISAWQEFLDALPPDCKLPSFPVWSMECDADYPISRKDLGSFTAQQLERHTGSFGVGLRGLTKKQQLGLIPPYARGVGDVFPDWKRAFISQNRDFFAEHRAHLKRWIPKIRRFPPSLQKFEWNCQGEDRDLSKLIIQFRASGVRVKRRSTAPSLVAMTTSQIPIIPWENRYMTVRERARLQSMDDLPHLPTGVLAMSALGNAVNVRVVSRILASVLKADRSFR